MQQSSQMLPCGNNKIVMNRILLYKISHVMIYNGRKKEKEKKKERQKWYAAKRQQIRTHEYK